MESRLSDNELRMCLTRFAEHGMTYLGTPMGEKFQQTMLTVFAEPLSRAARSWGKDFAPAELLHEFLCELLSVSKGVTVAVRAADADEPYKYLHRCCEGWVARLRGTSCAGETALDAASRSHYQDWDDTSGFTPMSDALDALHSLLADIVPAEVMGEVEKVTDYLAHNPANRSHEAEIVPVLREIAPALTEGQVRELMHIVWGVRPRCQETTILVPLLLDPAFKPAASATHSAALVALGRAFRASGSQDTQEGVAA